MPTHRTARIIAATVVMTAAPLAPSSVAHADNCADIQVVYARGTHTVAPVDPVGQALVNALSTHVPGRSLSVYGINYPASLDLVGGSSTGAADGWVHVQNLVAACPNTRVVLSGYSQGADVIDLLTTTGGAAFGTPTPMPDAVAGHVAAVVVFGNPSRKVGGGPLPSRSAAYGAKAVDVCLTGDPVCSNGTDLSAHGRYVSSGLVAQAALFAASRLESDAG
ncbi:cutinase family protein [Mycobacterium sp. shizuoka-1]|uniref:cutinase family protein n=1 Tax=Mycobacterium sp. shizuoka-1 TaxID=2039281 RepID=UPI000C0634C3|nr:cutinase family protein [Mycobacterium sp. shizuoka-1]GAY14100.1 putative cutinase [Mycobacterium sp. shizuoka-1]